MDTIQNLIINWIPNNLSEDKLSYFGSIIGAFIGLLGGAIVTYITIFFSTRQYRADKFDNTFFNLLNLFREVREEVGQDNIARFLGEISKSAAEIKIMKDRETLDLFINLGYHDDNLLKTLECIPGYKIFKKELSYQQRLQQENVDLDTDEKSQLNDNISRCHQELMNMSLFLPNICETIKLFEDTPNWDNLYSLHSLLKKHDLGIPQIPKDNLKHFYKKCKDQKKNLETINHISDSDKKYEQLVIEHINKIGNNYHKLLGAYFRSFYIVITFIMNSKIKRKKKKEYLRIIRSVLTSKEIIAIFYNSFYYSRGKKVSKLLTSKHSWKRVYFFSSKQDTERVSKNINEGKTDNPDLELTYFNYKELYFNMLDLSKLLK
ncbi:putative phage abortive infection protein [Lactococcus formosensis]|uniref:Phage abortive infection protein n=1 Tax=Lactococcus formosensis TaxID=1281486 RepID=A0A9Q8Y3U0_9LACT|nr:putative phage abortive infection protein [Lactococcus formosensis]USJ21572.1 putative phage abortive infection protein [Lactococcus formosensis]